MAQQSMPASLLLEVKGLYLNPSTFGNNAPKGALTIADNVVIDRPSVVATRRGFDNSFSTLVASGASNMFQFNSVKLLHGTDNNLYADVLDDGVWVPYADDVFRAVARKYYVPEPLNPASRVRGLETNKNFYFITSEGTYRLDRITGQPRLAGAPPGLSGTAITVGASGFLEPNTNVAYRIVFGYKDFNQQLVLGAPSSRISLSNTGAASANAEVTFQVPQEVEEFPADFFFQVYRSNASPDLNTEPDDEMALVYEDLVSNYIPLVGGQIVIEDIVPDVLKIGAALYTNQGQDGILQSNYRPPWCTDICTFKQYTFYANTRTIHNASVTLISAGASNGEDALIPGDTITFTPVAAGTTFVLTATAGANDFTLGLFQVSDTGNPGLDIQVTASNLAYVANGYVGNDFLDAYYTSTPGELPGKLRFDRYSLTAAPFAITVNDASSWEQTMPVTSINDSRPNRIYYSKFNQPEAVPIVNYIEVGSANAVIRRIVPLRDGIMVMKDDGVFRISNAAPPFTITPIDYNVRILADNTAAELDNKVYFLSDQGVVALSDSDAQIMSFVLDKTIIENTSPVLFPNLTSVAWGIAYQSARKYILFMPLVDDDQQATQEYVYNHLTEVWTRWTLAGSCGIIFKKDGKMYLGSRDSAPVAGDSYVYQERKSFTITDYADSQYNVNNTVTGNTATIIIDNPPLPIGVAILPGWTITQGGNEAIARVVSAVPGPTTTTILTDAVQHWEAGEVIIYVPITSTVETIQIDCENPGMNKQFSEMVYMFTEQGFTKLTAKISSNTAGLPITDILIPTHRGGWGIDPWGTTPWGGTLTGQGKIRRYVPQAVQRAGWLYINLSNAEAFTAFGWSGTEIFFKQTSSRQK